MKKHSTKEWAIALYESTRGLSGAEMKKVIHDFTELLFKAGSTKKSERIISEFIKYDKKMNGIVDIEIISARPLTEKIVDEIKKNFGKKVETTETIDSSLLGGVTIKTENMIFDGSLKKQLELLKQRLV